MKYDGGSGRQIPLAFSTYDQIDFELYEAGENTTVVTLLQNALNNVERKNIYLWGQTGSGKSHLLQALCTAAAGEQLNVAYVPLAEAGSLSPQLLEGLESLALVCLDDIDAIAGNAEWELAVFHLFNRLRDADVPLVMSAQQSPRGSLLCLPDLRSRLTWDHVYHLRALDDAAAIRALQKRAHYRGFDLPDEVADYLLKRVARDMHNLYSILDRLDEASLVEKKKLTVVFVKNLLDQLN